MNRTNFSAKTLEEAITKACVELGVTSDLLNYEVMEQGSAGILGIGARPWVISACNKKELEEELEAAALKEKQQKEAEENKAAALAAKKLREEKKAEAAVTSGQDYEVKKEKTQYMEKAAEPADVFIPAQKDGNFEKEAASMKEAASLEVGKAAEKKAVAFLNQIFDSIGMKVEIKSHFDEMLSELDIELAGDEMGLLIGKRGQTLNSLQYLIGQIINKHCSNYIRVKLDTENYRQRRQETLENLAHNMAAKVRRTHHAMALEPMNPYDRRIIHSSLQDEKDVITRSEGEEPYRHVVVCYVKHKK